LPSRAAQDIRPKPFNTTTPNVKQRQENHPGQRVTRCNGNKRQLPQQSACVVGDGEPRRRGHCVRLTVQATPPLGARLSPPPGPGLTAPPPPPFVRRARSGASRSPPHSLEGGTPPSLSLSARSRSSPARSVAIQPSFHLPLWFDIRAPAPRNRKPIRSRHPPRRLVAAIPAIGWHRARCGNRTDHASRSAWWQARHPPPQNKEKKTTPVCWARREAIPRPRSDPAREFPRLMTPTPHRRRPSLWPSCAGCPPPTRAAPRRWFQRSAVSRLLGDGHGDCPLLDQRVLCTPEKRFRPRTGRMAEGVSPRR